MDMSNAQKTEVIDISDANNICDSLGDYPLEAASGFGGLLDRMPVSCAGFNPDIQGAVLRECYKLEEVFLFIILTKIRIPFMALVFSFAQHQ